MNQAVETAPARFIALDGIRGWASLTVVIYHLSGSTWGALFPVFSAPYVAFLTNGDLAVSVFFVLSGMALSMKFLASGNSADIDRLLLKRYFRLTVPVLYSCLIMYILLRLHLNYNIAAARIVGSQEWLGDFVGFKPSAVEMLEFALAKVYVYSGHADNYNAFLWTMRFEFSGSLLTFAVLYCYPRFANKLQYLLIVAIVFMIVSPNNSCFIFGIIFAQVILDRQTTWLERAPAWNVTSTIMVIAIMWVAQNYVRAVPWLGVTRPLVSCGILLVFFLITSGWIKDAMSTRLSVFLGKISFPLFVLQFPILIAFTSSLIVLADQAGNLTLWAAGGIFGASLALALLAAWLSLWVERLTVRVCSAVGHWGANSVTRTRIGLSRRVGLTAT